ITSSNNTTRLPLSMITSTYRRWIGTLHHSSSIRQISPMSSTARILYPASRIPTGSPFSSSSTSTRCGSLIPISRSVFTIRNPQGFSRFIVDQRIPPLREPRPGLHLDHVVEQRPLEPELDLLGGGAERAAPPGARRGLRVAGEQLQLGGAGGERGELDHQPLHRAGGRRPLELRL